jgi:hypothetical protein
MGPKVEAAMRFVRAGGQAVIASLGDVGTALAGDAGTRIVPGDDPSQSEHSSTHSLRAAQHRQAR